MTTIFKLSFKTPVHFGTGRLSTSTLCIHADTLFSAMYIEAIRLCGEQKAFKLYEQCTSGTLRISDTFPYIEDTLYVPKPIMTISGEQESDSSLKKRFKNLHYIPVDEIDSFKSGNYIPKDTEFGKDSVVHKVQISYNVEPQPYNVGNFTYNRGCRIYFIAQYEDDFIFDIIDSLSYTGIGGKISSGYGKFVYTYSELPTALAARMTEDYKQYMTLSVCLPTNEQGDDVVNGAQYTLIRRSGFVQSEKYASSPRKHRDIYCFASGSVFNRRFDGIISDVSEGGTHPVYKYMYPMFIGI